MVAEVGDGLRCKWSCVFLTQDAALGSHGSGWLQWSHWVISGSQQVLISEL
jgi:hypothetical protein